MKPMTHISLFTGIGGIDLAAEWAGFKTILMVENNAYCQKVLSKHWPDVPIIGDIKDVKGTEYAATLVTGGFPCQPVSQAGKRKGKEDDRWLWPEMLRVITEVRPRWVVAENVAGLIRMGLDDCISDLENISYTTESYLIPACAINAPHRRNRIFIVADTKEFRNSSISNNEGGGPYIQAKGESRGSSLRGRKPPSNWESEPKLGRVASGISHRVDRLKCLGNAVVPQQIYPILKAIARIESYE